MPQRRRRFKQSQTLDERLVAEASRLREKAKKAAPGIERQALLRKAEQCEVGLHMSEWLRTPGAELTP